MFEKWTPGNGQPRNLFGRYRRTQDIDVEVAAKEHPDYYIHGQSLPRSTYFLPDRVSLGLSLARSRRVLLVKGYLHPGSRRPRQQALFFASPSDPSFSTSLLRHRYKLANTSSPCAAVALKLNWTVLSRPLGKTRERSARWCDHSSALSKVTIGDHPTHSLIRGRACSIGELLAAFSSCFCCRPLNWIRPSLGPSSVLGVPEVSLPE